MSDEHTELAAALVRTKEMLVESTRELIAANQYWRDRLNKIESLVLLSPKASDIDPYLPDLYWKFFSGIYSDIGSEIGHSDRMTLSHDGALLMTKRFRKEMLDAKRNDEETPGD